MKEYFTTDYILDPCTFGGKIEPYDFDGHRSLSDVTSQIISDMKFDEMCRKNSENKKYIKNKEKSFDEQNK